MSTGADRTGRTWMYPERFQRRSLRGLRSKESRRILDISGRPDARASTHSGGRRGEVRENDPGCEYYQSLGVQVRAVAIGPHSITSSAPLGFYADWRRSAKKRPSTVTLYNIPLFASPSTTCPPLNTTGRQLSKRSSPSRIRSGEIPPHDSDDNNRSAPTVPIQLSQRLGCRP